MKITNNYIFNGSREQVWQLLHEVDVLKSAMPGAEKLERVDGETYKGLMRVGVGPVSGVFSLDIKIDNEVPPESYSLHIDANGKSGFVKGAAHIKLVENHAGTTQMDYEADLQIGGRIAAVGQRLLDTVGKSIAQKGLDSMQKILSERLK